jgi:hypothetical protein
MKQLSVDEIDYRILPDPETIIDFYHGSLTTACPRNCIAFGGTSCHVAQLGTDACAETTIVPYSIRTIFYSLHFPIRRLESLVFEFGSKMESIAPSAFHWIPLKYIFIPRSLRFIGHAAFSLSSSLSHVYFDRHSSLWQLKSKAFSHSKSLAAITIPASIRQIHRSTFQDSQSLCLVTFEFPSTCWYIASGAFTNCALLKSIVLPPSIEVIDPALSHFITHIPHYSAPDNFDFCVEDDCLLGANGRQLVQYQAWQRLFVLAKTSHFSLREASC